MGQLRPEALDYVKVRRARGDLAHMSARTSGYILERFAKIVGEKMRIEDVKRKHVEAWITARAGVAPATMRTEIGTVRAFFDYLEAHEKIKRNPMAGVKAPRVPRSMPRELERDEIARILNSCRDERAECLVLLGVQEGLRVAEIAKLQVGDVDFRDRTVFITAGKGGDQRIVPLSDETFRALQRYLGRHPVSSGALIRSYKSDRQLTPGTIGRYLADIMRDAGVKERQRDGKSAHALRHTCAGDMLDTGADLRDVAEMLGHAHVSTTSIYTRRRAATGRLRAAAGGREYRQIVGSRTDVR